MVIILLIVVMISIVATTPASTTRQWHCAGCRTASPGRQGPIGELSCQVSQVDQASHHGSFAQWCIIELALLLSKLLPLTLLICRSCAHVTCLIGSCIAACLDAQWWRCSCTQWDALSWPQWGAESGYGRERHLVLLGEALPLDCVHDLLKFHVTLLLILTAKVVRDWWLWCRGSHLFWISVLSCRIFLKCLWLYIIQ